IQKLVKREPFKAIKLTPETRFYVTFLSKNSKTLLKLPYETPEKAFRILEATKRQVCSVVTLLPNRATPEVMTILDKEFGKEITTRNWNTVVKICLAGEKT